MNTPGQNVNADVKLVFAMMLTSGFDVTGRSIVLYIDCHRFHSEPVQRRVAGRLCHPLVSTPSAEVSLVTQVSHREHEDNALPEALVRASSEQLSKKEVELRHACSAQRLSDAGVGTKGQAAFEVESDADFGEAENAIKNGLARDSSIEKKLTFHKFYKQSTNKERDAVQRRGRARCLRPQGHG